MFPDSDYAVPVPSFLVPVPTPGPDPDYKPDVSVCFNSAWTPYIVGALKQLLLQATWDTTDAAELNKVQGQVFNLISMFAAYSPCAETIFKVYEEHIDMVAFREDCNCNLFYTCCDGTEKEVATVGSVPPGPQPGAGSPQPAPNGGHQEYCATMQAAGKLLIPTVVNTGDVIEIISAVGAGNDGGSLGWFCPDGTDFFAGQCTGGGSTSGGDPLPTAKHMSLILNIAGTFYNVMAGAITVPGGVSNGQAYIQVNDSTITDNSGSYQICVQVTNNQLGEWTHIFDFETASHGFSVGRLGSSFASGGEWIAGSGWFTTPNGTGGDDCDILSPVVASRTITRIELFYSESVPRGTGERDIKTDPGGINWGALDPGTGTFDTVLNNSQAVTQIGITLDSDSASSHTGLITKMIVTGLGTDPF